MAQHIWGEMEFPVAAQWPNQSINLSIRQQKNIGNMVVM